MSDAYKCDKCGDVETGTPSLSYKIQRAKVTFENIEVFDPDFDLCHECGRKYIQEFGEFITNE